MVDNKTLYAAIALLQEDIHRRNVEAGWWTDLETGENMIGKRNVPEMLMLAVSELAEAMEAYRKGLNDDKLPHRPGLEVEISDCLIRLFDMGGGCGLDLAGAFVEKLAYNYQRSIDGDHSLEARKAAGGKKF